MDINKLITKIRIRCGLNGILKNVAEDDEIASIIDVITRETYSRYFKHVIKLTNFKFTKENKAPHDDRLYKLPDKLINLCEKQDIEINGVKEINTERDKASAHIVGGNLVSLPTQHGRSVYMGAPHLKAGYNKARNDLLKSPIECEYIAPHFIYMEQMYREIEDHTYQIELFGHHPKNLSTIKDSYGETFEYLAELDVKIALWENYVAYLNTLNLGQSQIELKKEKWGDAEQERRDLLEEFEEQYINDYPTVVVI